MAVNNISIYELKNDIIFHFRLGTSVKLDLICMGGFPVKSNDFENKNLICES